jgi:hypothetical protein
MASGGKAGRRQPWLETALWELHWRGVFGHDWSRPRLWERTKAGRTPWLLKEPHLKNPKPNRVGEALLHCRKDRSPSGDPFRLGLHGSIGVGTD